MAMFEIFLFIHLVGFAIGLGTVLLVDTVGALWVARRVEGRQLLWLTGIAQKMIWTAVVLQLVSGAYLIDPSKISWLTVIKLSAVAILIINGLVLDMIRKQIAKDDNPDFWKLSRELQIKSVLSIGLSQLCWWTATIIGFLNAVHH